MRRSLNAVLILFGLVVMAAAVDLIPQVVKGFRYPDYDGQGQLKYEIMGDEARVQPDETIQITNLKLTVYEGGKAVTCITAPQCVFDRVKRTASSTSEVYVARSEIILTGKGFAWSINDGKLEIYDRVKVVLKLKMLRE